MSNDYTAVSGGADAGKGGYVPSSISSKPVNTLTTDYKPSALSSKPNFASKPAAAGGSFLARMAASKKTESLSSKPLFSAAGSDG